MKAVAWGTLFLAVACGCAVGGEGPPSWETSYFDGKEVRQGSSSHSVIVYHRQGVMPVLGAEGERLPAVPLAEGAGAMVIHCYMESSGGKVRSQGGSIPVAGTVIEVKGDGGKIKLISDETGYAVAGLPAGVYTASVGGLTRTFTVSRGATTLLSIRTGKRMVD